MSRRGFFERLRFLRSKLRGRMAIYFSGIEAGAELSVFGAPIVSRHPDSKIVLGERVMLISDSFATALGVNHPIMLRTLAAGAQIRIGNGVGISGGSICAAQRVEIGDDTLLGANVTIADTDFHSLAPALRHPGDSAAVAPVHIGRHVFLGTNSVVLKGVSIGDNSVIGAGSVVARDIPANCVAAGNPCRKLRDLTAEELRGA